MYRFIAFTFVACLQLDGFCVQAQDKHKRWADDIQRFLQQDEQRETLKGGIVFIGDSDVVRCDLEKWFPDTKALNRGFGGAHMDDILFYLTDVLLKHEPSVVVLSCGGNDLAANDTAANVHREFQELVAKVFKSHPNCRILVTSQHTPPVFAEADQQIRRFNELVERTAAGDQRITFLPGTRAALHDEKDSPNVDLFGEDQLHFNDEGYRKWTGVIAARLRGDK